MAYEPMTAEKMLAKLKAGEYENATAVRRGIGKLKDVNEAGKNKLLAAVAAYFGDDASKAPAKKGSAKQAAKAAAKQPAKRGPRKASVPAPASLKSAAEVLTPPNPFDATPEMLAKLHLAKERVGTIAQALHAMKEAKEIDPTIDFGDSPRAAASALSNILHDMQDTLAGVDEPPADNPEPVVEEEGDEGNGYSTSTASDLTVQD